MNNNVYSRGTTSQEMNGNRELYTKSK